MSTSTDVSLAIFNEKLFAPETIAELKKQFDEGEPYRHLMIDDFLSEDFADIIINNFPGKEAMRRHYEGLNEKKSEGSNFDQYHEAFQQLRDALSTPEFSEWLAKVTGIEGLILPDDFRGAGVHQGTDGSFLDIHVDFNIHSSKNLHRRLNLLIFMTKEWKDAYGGHLELWDKDVKNLGARIAPMPNRCAMFETSEISWHGYGEITVPDGVYRNSFFSYFYTPIDEHSKVKYHDTIFRTRPDESRSKAVKTAAKENAKNFVKGTMRKLGLRKLFDKIE